MYFSLEANHQSSLTPIVTLILPPVAFYGGKSSTPAKPVSHPIIFLCPSPSKANLLMHLSHSACAPRLHPQSLTRKIFHRYKIFYPDNEIKDDQYSTIITPQAFKRIKSLLDASKGTIVIGGEVDENRKYIAPTIVKDVTAEDSLLSEWVLRWSVYMVIADARSEKFLDLFFPSCQWTTSTKPSRL